MFNIISKQNANLSDFMTRRKAIILITANHEMQGVGMEENVEASVTRRQM